MEWRSLVVVVSKSDEFYIFLLGIWEGSFFFPPLFKQKKDNIILDLNFMCVGKKKGSSPRAYYPLFKDFIPKEFPIFQRKVFFFPTMKKGESNLDTLNMINFPPPSTTPTLTPPQKV